MSTNAPTDENGTAQDTLGDVADADDDCDCEDLAGDVPCADCYIVGDAEWGI